MAAPPPIKQIRLEDVLKADGNLDPEKFVFVLNQFMLATANALDRGLTFDNFRSQRVVLKFRTAATVANTFPIYFKLDPTIATVGSCVVEKAVDRSTTAGTFVNGVVAQVQASSKGGEVRYISGLAADKPYEITLRVFP